MPDYNTALAEARRMGPGARVEPVSISFGQHEYRAVRPTYGGGGGGEANTASNVGAGVGVFDQKTGVDLQFKSITSNGSIDIVSTASEIDVDVKKVDGGTF